MFPSAQVLKKVFLISVLFLSCMRVHAAELQNWPQRTPATLPTNSPIMVVNVWATWCKPCRSEIAMLSRWYQQQRNSGKKTIAVVGVSLDNDANLQRFTQQVSVPYPLYRYTGSDSRAWMQRLGNNIGGVPFTQVQAPKCGFQRALIGTLSEIKLNQVIAEARRQCKQHNVRL